MSENDFECFASTGARVVATGLSGSVVPEIFVEPCQGFRNVVVAPAVDDRKVFSRVGMEQAQAVFQSRLDGRHCGTASAQKERCESHQPDPEKTLPQET